MTIDTNVIVAFLGGDKTIIDLLSEAKTHGKPLFLPTVVEGELLSFSEWNEHERLATELFLEENFRSISLDRGIARLAAEIRRKKKIKFPDAAIAATALFTHTPLVTRNLKDFRGISGLNVQEI